MLTSLALILLVGLSLGWICSRLHLPRLIGMLLCGILLGPFLLDLLDPSILNISAELRRLALVIILLKAGLALDLSDLRRVGRPAVLLSFLPALCEIGAFTLFAPMLLGVTRLEAAIMGAVLGAVSPAVVVPRMLTLMEGKWGTGKRIPQLILAGASLDDVFVIVLFTTFCSIEAGGSASVMDFVNVPLSILLGVALGALTGLLLAWLFELCHKRGKSIRGSFKVIILLAVSCLLLAVEGWLEGLVAVSGLLAVMAMAMLIRMRTRREVTADLSGKFGRLWLGAEVLLFVLVGAAVDVRYTLEAGLMAVAMIFISLAFRSLGTWLCLLGTDLNGKERLFCVLSYLPKATVQAAIGGVPLAMGLSCGKMVLSVAVLSILITAPLGAILMDATYKRLLGREEEKVSEKM